MSKLSLHRSACALVILVLCLAFGVNPAAAQSTTDGAIGGLIKDPNGAVVPNASVTVRNQETNKESTGTSDDEGRFRIVQLQPGNYTVSVNVTGFAPLSQQNVVVEVGRVTSLELPLSITGSTENVEVTAEAPTVNTAQPDFSTNINQTSINELPINGRRASEFVRLTPGVTPDGDFGLNSFRGISGLLNNSTVDGGDNNNAFFSEERGRTRISYVISQASVREFQVNTSNYSSEYGRAAGGVVNTVTKSGTNDFHGELFYYIRDNKLGARNPSTTQQILNADGTVSTVALKPTDRRQQFGGALGGPIKQDKAFFFFTYDQQKRNFPGVSAFQNPSFLALSTANRTTVRNNIRPAFPVGTTDATLNARIDQGLAFLQSLTGEVARSQDQIIVTPKLDINLNNTNSLAVTYNRLRSDSPSGIESPPVRFIGRTSYGDDFVDVDTLTARLTSSLTPTLINEFRFQFGREFARAFAATPTEGEQTELARATTTVDGRLPQVNITGGLLFGNRQFLDRRSFPDERRWQFADSMTHSRGNHNLKFGIDINYNNDRIDNIFNEFGAYSYTNLVNYLSDFGNPAGRRYSTFDQAAGLAKYELNTTDYNFFIQDDWRISSRLTLNLGLRYEIYKLPEPLVPNNAAATLAAGTATVPQRFTQDQANSIIAQTQRIPEDKNNVGPRIGFAYDLTGDGKTSVRGGYGIYYGRIPNSFISSALTSTGAPGSQVSIRVTPTTVIRDAANNIIPNPIYPNVLSGTPNTGLLTAIVAAPNLSNPMIHQADVVIEREIARNTVVSASYLFSAGRSLPQFVDLNLPLSSTTKSYTVVGGPFDGQTVTTPFITGARPISSLGGIIQVEGTSESNYNALVLQANRRLTDGLQFQINYTFSKATDTGQRSGTFAPTFPVPLDPQNIELERGRSLFDIPHRFVASAVWAIRPYGLEDSRVGRAIFGGFQIAPIVTLSSGRLEQATIGGAAGGGGTAGALTGSGGAFRPFFTERNPLRRPSTAVVDLRVSRRFRIKEGMNFEALIEAFNLFNRANVTDVDDLFYSLTAATNTLTFNPAFGNTTALNNTTIFRERQVQIAFRFQF